MSLCPISRLSRSFRCHLIERICDALSKRYHCDLEEILHHLELLRICAKTTVEEEYQIVDRVAFWYVQNRTPWNKNNTNSILGGL